jgi:hypothetical protein
MERIAHRGDSVWGPSYGRAPRRIEQVVLVVLLVSTPLILTGTTSTTAEILRKWDP